MSLREDAERLLARWEASVAGLADAMNNLADALNRASGLSVTRTFRTKSEEEE